LLSTCSLPNARIGGCPNPAATLDVAASSGDPAAKVI
jgi:hypothetical protein